MKKISSNNNVKPIKKDSISEGVMTKGPIGVTGVVDNAFDLVPPDDWANIYISTATPCADTSSYK